MAARSRTRRHPVQATVTAIITLLVMIPFVWMVLLAFRDNASILNDPLSLPTSLNFDNFTRALETLDMGLLYRNTFVIAAVALVIQLLITFLSSFALTRLVYRRKWLARSIYVFFIAGQAIPPFILLFPVYRLTLSLGIENTHLSLILPYVAMSIGFNTLLFAGYLREFPDEIEEAAVLDGANLWTTAFRVVLPIVRPIVVTIFIFNVIYIWNEFPFAATLTSIFHRCGVRRRDGAGAVVGV